MELTVATVLSILFKLTMVFAGIFVIILSLAVIIRLNNISKFTRITAFVIWLYSVPAIFVILKAITMGW